MSGRVHRLLALGALVGCLMPAAGCGQKKDQPAILEAQKAMILDRTRPKQAFWDQVGRKGEALKKEHAAAAELASLQQQIAATQASLEQSRKQTEAAKETNAKAADVLSAQLSQLDEAQQQVAADQAELDGFRARQRRPGGP